VRITAFAYPAALVVTAFLLHVVGDDWWVTAVLSFLPALGFALPLPFVVLGLFLFRLLRLWWTQLVAAIVVLVPLMGFVLPTPVSGSGGVPVLRVLSFNVNQGYFGYDTVVERIRSFQPDVVLVQEAVRDTNDLVKRLEETYPHVHASTQFVMATRFPIVETTDPDRIPYFDRRRSPRFMRYVIDSSLGRLVLYNVHPISPRGTLGAGNFRAAIHIARTGGGDQDPASDVAHNVGLRRLQIEAVGRMASSEKVPVVVGGDFNLPGTSPVLRRSLSGFRDAFRTASSGFGYTFPAKYPWLRLDRIYITRDLEAVAFRKGCEGASDHLCVFAEIERSAD
jgi:vancomycin resistance protein VanJ